MLKLDLKVRHEKLLKYAISFWFKITNQYDILYELILLH